MAHHKNAAEKRQQYAAEGTRLLVSYDQLRGLGIPWSRVHLRRLCLERRFPQPIQISEGRIAWLMSDVLAWLGDQARGWPPGASDDDRPAP